MKKNFFIDFSRFFRILADFAKIAVFYPNLAIFEVFWPFFTNFVIYECSSSLESFFSKDFEKKLFFSFLPIFWMILAAFAWFLRIFAVFLPFLPNFGIYECSSSLESFFSKDFEKKIFFSFLPIFWLILAAFAWF